MFSEEIKQVDVVLEILDARIPLSSRNPEISKIVENKTRIVLLNKVDLVDKNKLDIWKKYFLKTNTADYIIPISAEKGMNIKDIKSVKNDLLAYFNNNKKDIINTINDKKVLDDELKESIVENAREYLNGKH